MTIPASPVARVAERPAFNHARNISKPNSARAQEKHDLPRRSRKGSSPKRFPVTRHVGVLELDPLRHEARMGGQSIRLTPTEFALLQVLAAHPTLVHRREELLQQVWGEQVHVTMRTVDVHMSKLRHKLRWFGDATDFVETVWGMGYRLRIQKA